MWIPFNPNPLGLNVGDCTVRAICAATDRDWVTVHREVCDLSEQMADMPSSNRVWWELLAQHGFTRRKLIDRCPDCYTVADFAASQARQDNYLQNALTAQTQYFLSLYPPTVAAAPAA